MKALNPQINYPILLKVSIQWIVHGPIEEQESNPISPEDLFTFCEVNQDTLNEEVKK